jgi:hypothetical protein
MFKSRNVVLVDGSSMFHFSFLKLFSVCWKASHISLEEGSHMQKTSSIYLL